MEDYQRSEAGHTSSTDVPADDSTLEDISDICGSWGKWQFLSTCLIMYLSLPIAYYNMGMPFLAPKIDHWCKKPTEYASLSTEEWKNQSIPYTIKNDGVVYSKCYRYEHVSNETSFTHNRTVIPCVSWDYDHSFYKATLTEQWDLVCERSWLPSFSSSLYFFGYMISCFVSGQLSDRFGRKPVLFASILCAGLSGIVCMLSPNFWVFAVSRFFLAYGRASTYLTNYVFCMEIVGKKHRILVAIIGKFSWGLSQMFLPGIVWIVRNWYYTELICAMLYLLILPSWRFIPESPRWLLSKSRIDEAEKISTNAIKMNKLVVTNLRTKLEILRKKMIEESTLADRKSVTFFHILKTKNIRRLSFILYFLWMANKFAYYGLSFTANDIGGDIFLFYFLSACVEVPVAVCLYYLQPKYGRRYSQIAFMTICSLACLLAIAVPKDLSPVMTMFGVIGKFSLSGASSTLYLISSEIYPTVVRNVGLGSCSTVGRVGAIVAPFMKEAAQSVHWSFPLALFGILELLGTGLAFLLPETKNIHLTDTLSQGEKIGNQTLEILKRRSEAKTEGKTSNELNVLL